MRTFSRARSSSSRSSVSDSGSVYGSFPHFSEVVKVRQEIADAVLSHAFRAAMHGAEDYRPGQEPLLPVIFF